MRTKHWTTLLAAGAALTMWGCSDYNNNPPSSNTTTHTDAADDYTDAAEDYNEAAQQELETAQQNIEEDADVAAEQGGTLVENARPLLDQAMADIDANRYEQAEAKLDQLEEMDLPESFDQQIADARALMESQRKVQPQDQGADANTGVMGY